MSETTKTTAKAASKTAAKQSTHAAKNVNKAAEIAVKQAVTSRDVRAVAVGVVGATLGHYAVLQARTILARRKLAKEIENATSGDNSTGGHESRESRA